MQMVNTESHKGQHFSEIQDDRTLTESLQLQIADHRKEPSLPIRTRKCLACSCMLEDACMQGFVQNLGEDLLLGVRRGGLEHCESCEQLKILRVHHAVDQRKWHQATNRQKG